MYKQTKQSTNSRTSLTNRGLKHATGGLHEDIICGLLHSDSWFKSINSLNESIKTDLVSQNIGQFNSIIPICDSNRLIH